MRSINPGYGQFRWVVALLGVAVILPTVCLLWFMNKVVKSERLVVRQRLTAFYKDKRLVEATKEVDKQWAEYCRHLERRPSAHFYRQFVSAAGQASYDALIVFNEAGQRLYPVLAADAGTLTRPSEVFADAWEMEFVTKEYRQAVERYEEYSRISDDHGRLAACIGKSRSLVKLGDLDQAIAECRQRVAFSPLADTGDSHSLALIASARLLMLGWMRDNPDYAQLSGETFRRLLAMLYSPNGTGFALSADENLFIARRVLEIGSSAGLLDKNADILRGTTLRKLIDAEERSILFAEQFPAARTFDDWQSDRLQRLKVGDSTFYGVVHKTGRGTCAALVATHTITSTLAEYARSLLDSYIDYRIVDDAGHTIAGTGETDREPFAAGPVSQFFPDWTVQLFFKNADVFEKAAHEQVVWYTWMGVLVITLILISGAMAAKSIGKQIKLNRLKNDFIATVTHELKTPLASMRVLVDTLLEGNYRNPQQVTEYLQLVSRENERLSRLIDNFLTFSRMERNKQAFQMRRTSPVSIARTAAQAVKTKFSRGTCHFETDIQDDLPDIKADHDAMVTVLVNLLDNAYKYSYDDKRIKLSVAGENGMVCFSVSDNGLGIPRRAFKKIFRRFYQVDRSLSRRAEGCGLGLSIAKFIVDAHMGTISVDSKPSQGSTFTVTIPAAPST
jgi:signal transduction histidine kinase/tetratricopeptide (TPR) repeat protein